MLISVTNPFMAGHMWSLSLSKDVLVKCSNPSLISPYVLVTCSYARFKNDWWLYCFF